MKRASLTASLLLALAASAQPALAADVGVAVTIGEPGFYGHIEIGDFPKPRVIYPEPVIVERVTVTRQPVYLHVPPGHAKHWDKHCHEYRACGERVLFVDDGWYNTVYVTEYQKKHGKGPKHHKSKGHDKKDKGADKDQGKGHGKGHD